MASLADLKQSQQQNQQVARAPKTIFDLLSGDPRTEKAIAAVATQFLTPERFLRLAVNAVRKAPLLMECDPQSVLGSFMASAALGLEPNTIQQQAFLIPYKTQIQQGNHWIDGYECQFQVGYRGFITLAHRSPHVNSLQAEAIHEHDLFDHLVGTESFLKYRKALKNRGALLGAFSYSKLDGGHEMATVLPMEEIYKIRAKSETYNALRRNIDTAGNEHETLAAQKKFDETPWVMWEDDMCAKSAIKKHAKQLPLMAGDAMASAVVLDSDGDDRMIDLAALANPDITRAVMQEGFVPEKDGLLSIGDRENPVLPPQAIRSFEPSHQEQSLEQMPPTAQRTEARVSFAQVAAGIKKASDLDALDAEADLIGEMLDAGQRKDLTTRYRARREELQNAKPARRRHSGMNVE